MQEFTVLTQIHNFIFKQQYSLITTLLIYAPVIVAQLHLMKIIIRELKFYKISQAVHTAYT